MTEKGHRCYGLEMYDLMGVQWGPCPRRRIWKCFLHAPNPVAQEECRGPFLLRRLHTTTESAGRASSR